MTVESWYSAAIVMAVINERGGLWKRVTSVVLLRATHFDHAFDSACEIGNGMEETYVNAEGEHVRWAFERVATLDELPEHLSSGTEVYSEPHDVVESSDLSFDSEFSPKLHPPGQSGVTPT